MPTGAAAATIKKPNKNKHFLSTVSRRQSTKKNLKRRSSFFLFTSGFLPFIFPSAYESVDSQPHKKTKQSYKRWSEIKIIHHHQTTDWASYRYQNENIFISRKQKKRPPRLMVEKDVCPAVVAQSPPVAHAKMRKKKKAPGDSSCAGWWNHFLTSKFAGNKKQKKNKKNKTKVNRKRKTNLLRQLDDASKKNPCDPVDGQIQLLLFYYLFLRNIFGWIV
jgi:hypothetical protein